MQDLYASDAWNGFFELIVTLLVLGLLVDVVIVVALTRANPRRPTFAQVCCACCIPGRRSTGRGALQEHVAWNALFAILVVLQLALTVGLFAFGFMLLIARTLLSEGCTCVSSLAGLHAASTVVSLPLHSCFRVFARSVRIPCDALAHRLSISLSSAASRLAFV